MNLCRFKKGTKTPDMKPEERNVVHYDPTSAEAISKYTNIITNKALPDHIKSILTRCVCQQLIYRFFSDHGCFCRTFGPFLANYFINPHAPAIRIKDKPRVDVKQFASEFRQYQL